MQGRCGVEDEEFRVAETSARSAVKERVQMSELSR